MKKLIVIILALALVLPLAACGGNNNAQPGTPTAPSQPAGQGTSPSPGGSAPTDTLPVPTESGGVRMETFMSTTGEITRYITEAPNPMPKSDPTTLFVGQTVVVENGNPGANGDSPVYDLLFDQFITIDFDTTEYVGKVFKEWELADDRLSMTFSIHDNITFHDGSNATMEDVFYSLWRLNQPELSRQADRSVFGNIDLDNSEIFDDYSGRIVFFNPTITVVAGLTRAWLFSKNHIETLGEDNAWWNDCIGTGMYKVDSVVQGDRYNLVRNDNYWGSERGAFENIVIRYYADASTLYIDFETGVLDIIINPLPVDVSRVINGDIENAVCDIYPQLQTFTLVFNEEMNPVLNDINVRKALIMGLDPFSLNRFSFDFLGLPATSVMPRSMSDAYNREHVQDIEGAKQALADAGYAPGELTLIFGTNTQNTNFALAEAIEAQMREVGIDLQLLAVDPTVHVTNFRNTGSDIYDMSIMLGTYPTMESIVILGNLSRATGSVSFAAVSDPHADELALAARAAMTVSEKRDIMIELQQFLMDEYWHLPIVETRAAIVYRDYITGIRVVQPRSANINLVSLVG